jgi:hypothetical protein
MTTTTATKELVRRRALSSTSEPTTPMPPPVPIFKPQPPKHCSIATFLVIFVPHPLPFLCVMCR